MFTLPLVYGVALLKKDKTAYLYGLPAIAIGWLIAAYQTLLQWKIIVPKSTSCSLTGVSCSEPIINWFGFLTIPFGSLLAFTALATVSFVAWRHTPAEIDTASRQARHLVLILTSLAVIAAGAILIINANQA